MSIQIQIIILACVAIMTISCREEPETLHIIHAGSLSVPVMEIADSFMRLYPDVKVQTEAWGSRMGARRISEMGTASDVFISADYKVIDDFLIPEHASWNIPFAGNEMTIAFNGKSRYAGEINSDNWYAVLLREDVIYGRSDPDADPCGARAVITSELAGMHYGLPGLSGELLSRHKNMIRPKETDLLLLLENGVIDYFFIYRSVAEQHNLEYVVLPDEINLRDPLLNSWYEKASIRLRGRKPGETIKEAGEAIVYGITIPLKSKNSELANEFIRYFLSQEGLGILERNYQNTFVPSFSATYDKLPENLKPFALGTR